MSDQIVELKTEYRNAAFIHGQATSIGDSKTANKSHDELIETLKKMRTCGKDGELALLSLTEDKDDFVAGWAATHILSFDEKYALNVLDKLSKKSGIAGFDAKMVIQEWKKGNLNIN